MSREPDTTPAGDRPADSAMATLVQQAVEQFVAEHAAGRTGDPAAFVARHPAGLRTALLAQIREFLAFDGLLGHQEWAEPQTAESTPGRCFGDFVIQEELGRGGMGIVYLAHQKSLNRRVALKVMASGLTLSKRHVERFRREAAATAQLRHPAIVAVHALAEVDGTFALAMDYVAGRNLGDLLDDLRLANGEAPTSIEGPLGLAPEKGYVAECAMFVAQLASALATAHQANVVHRDLKPRNLMLDDRRQVRLLDFGLAKSLGEGSLSMSGEITGTAHYMSPEQTLAKRVEVDHRADIWALGVILYEMLTLRRPFDGKNLQQVVYAICFGEPAPLQRHNPKVPRDLVTICQKALEKDPDKRYQTAAAFEADLLRFLRWEPIQARPASQLTKLLKWTRRHRTGSAIAAGALLAALVVLGVVWYRGVRADGLLALANEHYQLGRYAAALGCAQQALELRNDGTALALISACNEASQRVTMEASKKAMESTLSVATNRERAIALALAAEQLHASVDTRSAVLYALGNGSVTRTLHLPAPAPELVGTRWSPDGRLVATLGFGGHVQLWDPVQGAPVQQLHGHTGAGPVAGLVFAADDHLVTAGTDQTLRRWRVHDGLLQQTVALPGLALVMRGDQAGRRVLVLTYGTPQQGPFLARVHDTTTLAPVSPAIEHPQLFVASALSPDGDLAATCSGSSVKLWRVATGDVVPLQQPTRGRVRALVFRPDSALLAIASDHTVHLVRTADGTTVGTVQHSLEVTSLAFDPAGARLLSGSRDWTARLWQLPAAADGRLAPVEVATLVDHQGPVDHVAFDRTGGLALTATGGQAGELLVFDVAAEREATPSPVQRYEVGPSIQSAEFAPDSRSVLALAGGGRAIVWDFAKTRGVVTMRQGKWAGAVAFTADGQRVVTAGTDEQVRAWSAHDGSLLWTSAPFGRPQTRLDVDAAGERIASSGRQDGAVRILRLTDGHEVSTLRGHGDGVTAVRFHADGRRLLTAGRNASGGGNCIVWNTDDWSRGRTIERPRPLVAADVGPDGRVLATLEEDDDTVRLWAPPDGAPLAELRGDGQRLTAVRFTPDGRHVLTAGRDGSARLHDLQGTVCRTFAAGRPLRFATVSPDGRFVLTCGEGSTAEAMLWRLADGEELLRFHGHRGPIEWGAVSHDGSIVATTARDGTVCLWPTDPVGVARRLQPAAAPPPPPQGR